MTLFDVDRRTKFLILIAVMILWMASLTAIPFWQPWGLDLHNVHIFQQCVKGRSPYLVDAHACGDILDRPFYYPPFLFAFFRWLRPLSLPAAMYIWTVFMFTSFGVMFWAWARKIAREPRHGERHELVFFCALLLLQYPFVFALERGNTDTVAIVFYTIGAYLFVRRQVWLAGMAAGLAAGFRLSPIVAVVIMTGALLWAWRSVGFWTSVKFGGGALTSFALTLLIFFKDAKLYLFTVLPAYAKQLSFASPYGHSLPTYVGDGYRNFARVLAGCLAVAWIWGGKRALARGDAAMALAGALAASTYAQATSFDYNLITTYPLLLLLFLRAQRTNRWALLGFGVLAIAGDRRLFTLPNAVVLTAQLHLTMQLAFLVVAALVAAQPEDDVQPAPPPPIT
jgi:hypothetical protein